MASAHEISFGMLRLPSLSVRGFLKSYHAGIGRCLGAAFGGSIWIVGRRTGPYKMASTVPELAAVLLIPHCVSQTHAESLFGCVQTEASKSCYA